MESCDVGKTSLHRSLTVHEHPRSPQAEVEDDADVNPLPEPFQPPLPALAGPAPRCPFTVTARALHLPSALLALHCSAALPLPPPTAATGAPLLLDYPALATAVVIHVGKALATAGLAWRQLSRLRCFYCPVTSSPNKTVGLEEPLLREALAGALRPEAQGVARTFVPMSSLLAAEGGQQEQGQGLEVVVLRVQALALDLERLRTEAWVHEVPDGGV